ncbi:alanine racemase [Erythrobacter mangrovi]|uniref:Alanine racemase n=1 Tax=Erythrobacter mangrovi TaxID=2739433 RepID=A0A7D3XT65_9SPHN|nr:alanine racemase [Erythrobacter mangrovi]QKG72211.1 alanine racemase [Erythrobacter mangrovi]
MARVSRRGLLIGGGALAAAGIGTLVARPAVGGGMHSPYFAKLSQALRQADLMRPTLVIDRARLDANAAAIRRSTQAAKLPLRVVAKSLPSPALLARVMQGMGDQRLMVFSAEMLLQLFLLHPQASYLMGKPLPVSEFVRFTERAGAEAAGAIEWLIDTPQRLEEYSAAAKARDVPLRANFEIDVGLHRGGFADAQSLAEAARKAQAVGVGVAGLMGYDPHVPKMPSPDSAYADAQEAYAEAIAALGAAGIPDVRGLTLNGAGSPTFRRHCAGTVANEVSVGSAFVKPGDFDYDDLADLMPAAFIATPVLKREGDLKLPGVEAFSGAMHWFDRNTERGFFVHGGHWLAKPHSPPGLQYSKLFGRSSNQELLTGSHKVDLRPGDTVFYHPDQSEALFLQFGDIAVYDQGAIVETWPTLPISA